MKYKKSLLKIDFFNNWVEWKGKESKFFLPFCLSMAINTFCEAYYPFFEIHLTIMNFCIRIWIYSKK